MHRTTEGKFLWPLYFGGPTRRVWDVRGHPTQDTVDVVKWENKHVELMKESVYGHPSLVDLLVESGSLVDIITKVQWML